MHSGASPQPDEACIRGLGSSAGGVGFRLALKAVHNVTVHSPLAAVGWPLPGSASSRSPL